LLDWYCASHFHRLRPKQRLFIDTDLFLGNCAAAYFTTDIKLVLLNITKLAHSTLRNRAWQHWSFPTWPELDYSSHPRLRPDLFIISMPNSFLLFTCFSRWRETLRSKIKGVSIHLDCMLLGRDTSDKTNGFEQKHRTCLPQSALPWKTSKSASYSAAQRFTATHRQLSRGISFTHPQRNATLRACQKQQQTHLLNRSNRHSTCTQYNTHPSPSHRTTVPSAKGTYTILRKTTIVLGPYRRSAETWPNIQVTLKPNSFTR
jgi:hypothetical protein